jgi:hypothetical protein
MIYLVDNTKYMGSVNFLHSLYYVCGISMSLHTHFVPSCNMNNLARRKIINNYIVAIYPMKVEFTISAT